MSTSTETGLGGGGGPYEAYIVYDTFTDDDATSLDAHAPEKDTEGDGWTEAAGDWSIDTNEAKVTSVVTGHAYIVTAEADVEIQSRQKTDAISEDYNGLTMRKSANTNGNGNWWRVIIAPSRAGDDTYLQEMDNGVVTTRGTYDGDWSASTYHVHKVVCNAQSITYYIDGDQLTQYTSASFNENAVWHGPHVQNSTGARVDWLWIKTA